MALICPYQGCIAAVLLLPELGLWPIILGCAATTSCPLGLSHYCTLLFPRAHATAASLLAWVTVVSTRDLDPVHRRYSHACATDTSATSAARALVPQNPGTVVVPFAPDSGCWLHCCSDASMPDLVPREIPMAGTSYHRQNRKIGGTHQPSPMRTSIALATTATHRTSSVLATEDQGGLDQCWPQLADLHEDYAAVPSQESESLHLTWPALLQLS